MNNWFNTAAGTSLQFSIDKGKDLYLSVLEYFNWKPSDKDFSSAEIIDTWKMGCNKQE